MALSNRDRQGLAAIARQIRAEDPELAAALAGRATRPPAVAAPVGLRALAFLLLAIGTLNSVNSLILVALAVFGLAHYTSLPDSRRPSPTAD